MQKDMLDSWYDDQFSITSFKDRLIRTNGKVEEVMKSIAEIMSENNHDYDSEEKYVVNLDEDTMDKIKSGIIKLDTSKSGEVYAQIKNPEGKYGKKLSIRKELEEKGLSAKEVEMALQMKAIQDVLVQIVGLLSDIGEHVCDIMISQQNDRIGLYYSGINMFIEARAIKDPDLKKLLTAQAVKALNDANAQMIQQLRTDIQYLAQKKYMTVKGGRQDRIDEKIANINSCYEIAYRSAFMKAALYNDIEEIPAMLTVCEEYGRFIEKLIVPHSGMLTEMDKDDVMLESSIWERRAGSLAGCNDVVKSLSSNNKIYYLEMKEGN